MRPKQFLEECEISTVHLAFESLLVSYQVLARIVINVLLGVVMWRVCMLG